MNGPTELKGTALLLTAMPEDYKGLLHLRNSQVEETHRAKCGESARSFHARFEGGTLPESPRVHQAGSFLNTPACLWGFMEVSVHRHDGLNHWPLVTELPLQPVPSPEVESEAETSNTLITRLVSLAARSPPYVLSQVISLTQTQVCLKKVCSKYQDTLIAHIT